MNPDKSIRKLQSELYTSGFGIVLFSVWNAIKGIMTVLDHPEYFAYDDGTRLTGPVLYLSYFFVFIMISLMTLLFVWFGRRTMGAGLGKKTGNLYVAVSCFLLLYTIIIVIADIYVTYKSYVFDMNTTISIIVDFTTLILYLRTIVIFLSMRKKLRAQLSTQ